MKSTTYSILGLLLVLLTSGCSTDHSISSALPYYRSAELTPEWLSQNELLISETHKINDFNLVNQNGDVISSTNTDGHIYVANFFFVQCTSICPTMRSNMSVIQNAFADDDSVLLLSHSVMPETDTVEKLNSYARINEVNSDKWHLLTGAKEEIYDHALNSYFVDFNADLEDTFLHTETFFLVDQHRNIRGIYNGTLQFDVQRLIEDIAVLKSEAMS